MEAPENKRGDAKAACGMLSRSRAGADAWFEAVPLRSECAVLGAFAAMQLCR